MSSPLESRPVVVPEVVVPPAVPPCDVGVLLPVLGCSVVAETEPEDEDDDPPLAADESAPGSSVPQARGTRSRNDDESKAER